jgi:glycosyltransferase involved in cell wall biosynthesis
MGRLADLRPRAERPPGVRVVIDTRPLQEPERSPITAHYLDRLLAACAADPNPGESFIPLLRTMREDPTVDLERRGLPIAGRRRLPPTSRAFRSAGLTIDSFLLRGAELGTGAGAVASGAAGSLYHTAGGAVPIASRLPVVATLLDLAPWELPERYAASAAARFGHRLRARNLQDARRVIVSSWATATSAERLLHLREDRLVVVPLAADPAFHPGALDAAVLADLRARFDLPERYLVFAGRHDARKDLATLFDALVALAKQAPGDGSGDSVSWPPVVVLAGASGEDNAESPVVAAAARRAGAADLVRLTPRLEPVQLAALEAGSIGHVQPTLSDGTGLAVLEALAVGIPVICSRTGPLPEIVGTAGIVVEPRDRRRLAAALRALWEGGAVAQQVTRAARARAATPQRTWTDVARDTRKVYAATMEPDAEAA